MEPIIIHQKIKEIRRLNVILDSDLAILYGVETKYLKRTVKNNIKRFPPDFKFTLTKEENEILRCSFSTSKSKAGGKRYLPYVSRIHSPTRNNNPSFRTCHQPNSPSRIVPSNVKPKRFNNFTEGSFQLATKAFVLCNFISLKPKSKTVFRISVM